MTRTPRLALGLTGLLLATACAAQATTDSATSVPGAGLGKVLFLGDSVAVGESLPMTAAFQASRTGFQSIAADGGGNVVGPFADQHWKQLPGQLSAAKSAVVIYQITTYDWGSQQDQHAAYDRLLTMITDAGAKLIFVTMPPIRPDDFYQPHLADLSRTTSVAQAVAVGKASVLDASAVWGNTYQQVRDGKPDRSADGVHTCPQGAARFTTWLLGSLATLFPGFTPADPRSWANTGWSADRHFQGC